MTHRDTGIFTTHEDPYPVVATIAVLIRDGRILLVRRANPPDAGLWGFPGGKIERGESIEQAAMRELHEETGIVASAHRTFNAIDAFDVGDDGRLRHHFVLIAVLCTWRAGEPAAGDDALEAGYFDIQGLGDGRVPLSRNVAEVALQGADIFRAELAE
ncbi:NUDIX hydrolase [Halomonas organivorans]|uniref:Mutator protein MutT n=1 Tax=Halomonas organivorans TaxID=257772 RepID=A0A7W5BXA8_9GAMM|nr:NUDIX hydrolase [Halomonas organivorans]MBB3140877.1 mutator protein MutT [Halomonas organivorans]